MLVRMAVGQHIKKSSISDSSSDMLDLEECIDGTPNLLIDPQMRLAPFFGASGNVTERSLQPINCCKQSSQNSQTSQKRPSGPIVASIETDV